MNIPEKIWSEIEDLELASATRKRDMANHFLCKSDYIPLIFEYDFKIIYLKKIHKFVLKGEDFEYAVKILTRTLLKKTKEPHLYKAIDSIKYGIEINVLKDLINYYSMIIEGVM